MRLAPDRPWAEVPGKVGGLELEEVDLGRVTEILPLGDADVSEALRAAIGVGLPGRGRTEASGGVRVVWSGREAALVLGPEVEVEGALCVDQSDGWAALRLGGEVRGVLARLCPLDLRERSFPVGAAARSLLNHVGVLLVRVSKGEWLLLAPRSMAGTVLEELSEAARALAAGRALVAGGAHFEHFCK